MRKRWELSVFSMALVLSVSACGYKPASPGVKTTIPAIADTEDVQEEAVPESEEISEIETENQTEQKVTELSETESEHGLGHEQLELPPYNGEPSTEVNGNIPLFTEDQMVPKSFEEYSELDELGRCGVAFACVGQDLMPAGERGPIGEIHPSGWHTVKYEGIDGNYLYNRCHLIAHSLTGEDANERNLITGTRYMNKDGMNPYEILVTDYIRETGNHVLYRVTPIFEGTNPVASGVTMEARSIEDDAICFFVYCYNVQPGVEIDYATGESTGPEYTGDTPDEEKSETEEIVLPEDTTYVLNTNTMRFHYPDCDSVRAMSEKNRLPVNSSREELIEDGYKPCGNCKP